jgi:RNA polymerase sigma factor (sigma-70 family)
MVVSAPKTWRKTVYEELRPLLFSIAYRMVGSAGEAEDLVQEAFLRFHRETSEGADIDSPKAWLTTVTTRLAINQLQSARVRRENYVGTWFPEPLLTDTESEVVRHAETADSLSLAFLVLLESLGPVERAVFSFTTWSTTATTRSRRSSARVRTTVARSRSLPAARSRRRNRASRLRVRSVKGCHGVSWTQSWQVTRRA